MSESQQLRIVHVHNYDEGVFPFEVPFHASVANSSSSGEWEPAMWRDPIRLRMTNLLQEVAGRIQKELGFQEEKRLNATYIISVARKLGCSVFLLHEDIVEVNPKMILTLIASIMLWSLTKQTTEDTSIGISDSDNGSVTGSFSNLVLDDNTSEAYLPHDNGSESASEHSFKESRGGD